MRFLVDANLGVGVAAWLRQRGHDAVHLGEEGLQRLPDPEVWAKAVAERRVLLTCDLDFGEIIARAGGRDVILVVFRMFAVDPPRVIRRLDKILASYGAVLAQGAVVVVDETRVRVRRLPLRP